MNIRDDTRLANEAIKEGITQGELRSVGIEGRMGTLRGLGVL
jgi:hypothetical protein